MLFLRSKVMLRVTSYVLRGIKKETILFKTRNAKPVTGNIDPAIFFFCLCAFPCLGVAKGEDGCLLSLYLLSQHRINHSEHLPVTEMENRGRTCGTDYSTGTASRA